MMMTKEQAIDIAKRMALIYGAEPRAPSYLPRTLEAAAEFMPHEWVIFAVMASAELVAGAIAPQPDEEDWTEVDLWAEVHRLRAAVKGPDGFDSWQQAATAERIRRSRSERELRNIAEAKRFDRDRFDDDTSFADWAQSRARHMLSMTRSPPGNELNELDRAICLCRDCNRRAMDAERFAWLTEDHADPVTRAKCRELLGRMGVMSYSSACTDIDHAMAADIKRSMLRTADAVIAARCQVCGCEEKNSRDLFTCECPAPLGPNVI